MRNSLLMPEPSNIAYWLCCIIDFFVSYKLNKHKSLSRRESLISEPNIHLYVQVCNEHGNIIKDGQKEYCLNLIIVVITIIANYFRKIII